MNQVLLIGNLCRDPELKETQGGVAIATFSLAVRREYKNDKGEYPVDFINLFCMRNLAEICATHCAKGDKISVCGKLRMNKFVDNAGKNRATYEVQATEIEFLTPKGKRVAEEPLEEPPF